MSVSLTVMTFNLHEDQPEGSPDCWEKRRDLCISVITSYSPLILCTQQGVKSQLDYLQQGLPVYDQFGISRKGDQDTTDEHCTIFYDKEKVEFLEGGTFWLSESPSVPGSMSWGSVVPCIATWATFQLKGVEPPGFSFQVVNTCMDQFSPRARRRSALLTWQHIASLPPSLPVIYCGGFNTQKESTTGRFLLGRSSNHAIRTFSHSTNLKYCHPFTIANAQRAWCGGRHEGCVAKCAGEEKCVTDKNLPWIQR